MKLILSLLLVIGCAACFLAAPNCSEEEKNKCFNHQRDSSKLLRQTKEEVDEFCSTMPGQIKCQRDYDNRCGSMTPIIEKRYEIHEGMIALLCKGSFQKKYLRNIPCISEKAFPLIGKRCVSNEMPLDNDENQCARSKAFLKCSDNIVKKECGREARYVFKKIFQFFFKNIMVDMMGCT